MKDMIVVLKKQKDAVLAKIKEHQATLRRIDGAIAALRGLKATSEEPEVRQSRAPKAAKQRRGRGNKLIPTKELTQKGEPRQYALSPRKALQCKRCKKKFYAHRKDAQYCIPCKKVLNLEWSRRHRERKQAASANGKAKPAVLIPGDPIKASPPVHATH